MTRPKKPTKLKEFEGNRGKRRLEADDYQPSGVPIKPTGLDPAGSWLWDFVVPELAATGVATKADTAKLAGMVMWWSKWKAANDAMEADGGDLLDEKLVKIASRAWGHFERIASRFGLDPSSRAGLKLETKNDKPGILDFLDKGKCLS